MFLYICFMFFLYITFSRPATQLDVISGTSFFGIPEGHVRQKIGGFNITGESEIEFIFRTFLRSAFITSVLNGQVSKAFFNQWTVLLVGLKCSQVKISRAFLISEFHFQCAHKMFKTRASERNGCIPFFCTCTCIVCHLSMCPYRHLSAAY